MDAKVHSELKVNNKFKAFAIAVQRYGNRGALQKEIGKNVKNQVRWDVLTCRCPDLIAFCPSGENQCLIVVL